MIGKQIEGETLSDRMARGPIAAGEALKIALQILAALEAELEKGILHLDLKPANVKIGSDGNVEVLGFGVVPLVGPAEAGPHVPGGAPDGRGIRLQPDFSQSPTLSLQVTGSGVVPGTAAYLSPEQAKGAAADARSDIFSFGCVLYEMLTGRQAFQGETTADVLAGVLARDADLAALPPDLNPRIHELLRRCLEKNPKRRWHAAADVRVEIEGILADARRPLVSAAAGARQPLWKRAAVAVASVIAGALAAGSIAWSFTSPRAAPVTRFTDELTGDAFSNAGRQVLAISPDGTQFVYTSGGNLLLRSLREPVPVVVQGTRSDGSGNAVNPVFSPDGQSIVYFAPGAGGGGRGRGAGPGTLKRIPVSGGAPRDLCAADPVFGMSWGPGDSIVFGQQRKGILRVSANGGGEPDTIVAVKRGETAQGPQILPGGEAVLFTLSSGGETWDKARIMIQKLQSGAPSGEPRLLIDGGTDARYLPTGHLVYALGGNVLAVPFDVRRLEVKGRSVPVVQGVVTGATGAGPGGGTGSAQFSVSNTGTLVYVPGAPSEAAQSTQTTTISLVERSGKSTQVNLPADSYVVAHVSPNGRQLALGTDDGQAANVSVYDLAGTTAVRRLTLKGRNSFPIWSGNGERILFQSDREGDAAIWWQRADGTDAAVRLTKPESGTVHIPEFWIPSTQTFSFSSWKDAFAQNADSDILVHSVEDNKDTPLAVVPSSQQRMPAFSPDGRWVAYRSSEAGAAGIYVEPYPNPTMGNRHLLPLFDNAVGPLWSPDGKELFFYRNQANTSLFRVNIIRTQPTFESSNADDLPLTAFVHAPGYRQYDITRDGKFVTIYPAAQTTTTATGTTGSSNVTPEIKVVINWFEELNKLVPRP